ncbi:MAG: Cys-tRNA(Pro)/Cys-tRNA(Cys) deacylase [Actinomycetes bacterium]|jgi:Cys-tRNA(Pro)/Cys-tRNA(Cys) deacylase
MAKEAAAVETRATDLLSESGIPYAVHQYDSATPLATEGDSLPIDAFDYPRRVFRTQIVEADGLPLSLLVPIAAQLDLTATAAAVGATSALPLEAEAVKKATGYQAESVSPIGMRKYIAGIVDITALDHRTVFVSAGEPGFVIELSPTNLVEVMGARTAPITRRDWIR